jgi:hypothetical protein
MNLNQRRDYLRALINRILDDSAQAYITRASLCTQGAEFDPEVVEILKEWQNQGYLQILVNPNEASYHEPVIKMHKFIGRASSIPGFLEPTDNTPRH